MSLSATRKPRAVTESYLARRLRAAVRGRGRLPAAFRRAFAGSVAVCWKAHVTQRRSAGSSAASVPVTATQPVMRRPGMGSKSMAPCCFASAMPASSSRSTTRSSCRPANMFPFTKAAGYPNMGRRSAPPPAGTTRAKAAISSGGDFFQAIGVPARSPSLALESRQSRRRRRRAMLGRGGSRDGEGHLRRRLLLGRGGSVPPRGRRRLERRRLLGRPLPEPDLPRRLLRRHRPRRVRAGGVRPGARLLRAAPRRVLGEPRPDPAEPPGPRHRRAVPLGDLLPHPGAGGGGARLEGTPRGLGALPAADRHRDHAGIDLLPRRGVPPALPREARAGALPDRLESRLRESAEGRDHLSGEESEALGAGMAPEANDEARYPPLHALAQP